MHKSYTFIIFLFANVVGNLEKIRTDRVAWFLHHAFKYNDHSMQLIDFHNSRAGAKRGARVVIPLGDLLHPGILANIAESKVAQILCHGWDFKEWRLEISNLIGSGKKFAFQ